MDSFCPATKTVGMIHEVPQLHPLGLGKPEGLLSSAKQSEISPVPHRGSPDSLTDAQAHESQECASDRFSVYNDSVALINRKSPEVGTRRPGCKFFW